LNPDSLFMPSHPCFFRLRSMDRTLFYRPQIEGNKLLD
jgi:hypothetical protein